MDRDYEITCAKYEGEINQLRGQLAEADSREQALQVAIRNLREVLATVEAKVEKLRESLDRARVGQQALPKSPAEFWKGYWQGQIRGFEEALK